MATKFSKLEKAKSQLVLSHPFFASILLRGKLVERKDIPTAAVDARGTIYYNHDFFEKELEIQEVVFVLAHECMHKILHHFARLNGRNPQKANYAQDACINDILQSSGVGKMPAGAVNMPVARWRAAPTRRLHHHVRTNTAPFLQRTYACPSKLIPQAAPSLASGYRT